MNALPITVGLDYLVPLLHKPLSTLRTDINRRPESLPPRINIPGSRKILFFEAEVLEWINSFRHTKPEPKKRGRPSQASRQYQQESGCNSVANFSSSDAP